MTAAEKRPVRLWRGRKTHRRGDRGTPRRGVPRLELSLQGPLVRKSKRAAGATVVIRF